jgi:hypothetical protein
VTHYILLAFSSKMLNKMIRHRCKSLRLVGTDKKNQLNGRWIAKLVTRLLATAALCIRIQTSLKNTKWAT